MITGEDIEYLVWTYDLPETTGRKIRDIVVRQHETIGFASYDELYQRVSHLVERFTEEFGAKYWLRLDQGLEDDSKRPLHDVFGIRTFEEPSEKGEVEENPVGEVTFEDVRNLLLPELDAAQIAVLEHLVKQQGNGGGLRTPPEYLLEHLPEISSRLEELVKVYEKDGRILMPRRSIVEIRWNPQFFVKYGKRRFNGNPLQFFRDNLDVYSGMGRKRLHCFDDSLYQALREAGQLDAAIPDSLSYSSRRTPEQIIRKVTEVYPVFDGSLKTASIAIGHDEGVFRKYWRRNGFAARPSGVYEYDLWRGSRGGVDYKYLGESMAKRINERGLIRSKDILIGDISIKPSDGLSYDDACDNFGILSCAELDGYTTDSSYLVRNSGEQSIDRLSALYLAAISPTIGLRSVAYNLVGVVIGLSLDETDKVLRMAGISRNPDYGFPSDKVRKRIFNPTFGFALKHLDLW